MSDVTTEPEVDDPDAIAEPELDEPDDEALDDEEADDDEPELDEPEAADQASSYALLKALEREEGRHRRALAKALDVPEDELHECPTCQAMGYTPDAIAPEPELVQDPYLQTCERCRGNGEVKTGAAASALWKVPCSGCGGSGYVTKAEQPGVGAQPPNGEPAYVAPAPAPAVSPADAAAAAELRAKGYMVVDPIVVSAPAGG